MTRQIRAGSLICAVGVLCATSRAGAQGGRQWFALPGTPETTMGEAVTVVAEDWLYYTVTTRDLDTVKLIDPDGRVLHEDQSWDRIPTPAVYACSCSKLQHISLSGNPEGNCIWQISGTAAGPFEKPVRRVDWWWFDDMLRPAGANGAPDSRDDAAWGPFAKVVNILPNCGWVSGHVTVKGSDKAIPASVTLVRYGEPFRFADTQADAGGQRYEFRFVPRRPQPTAYTCRAVVDGEHGPLVGEAQVVVTAGEGVEVNIQVEPYAPLDIALRQ